MYSEVIRIKVPDSKNFLKFTVDQGGKTYPMLQMSGIP